MLDGWAGTLIVVSHDRYLLERVCDHQLALLGDGRLRDLPGGVEEYLRLREAMRARREPAGRHTCWAWRWCGEHRVLEPPRAAANPAQVREARKVMARVEKQLTRLTEREERLHDDMVENSTDPTALADLTARLREVVEEREVLELEWLEAAEVVG